MVAVITSARQIGPLRANDLESVIAIDRSHTGHSRGHFFEKRFAAAEQKPEDFVHLGIVRDGRLRGFALARVLRGEFGRQDVVAVLDALGVDVHSQDVGIGQRLMEALVDELRLRGARSLHSQAKWTDHDLLGFFEVSGFTLSPRLVIERPVAVPLIEELEEP